MNSYRLFCCLLILISANLLSCSPKYSYSPTSRYGGLDDRQVSDEDIQNAFSETKPGINLPVKVAWYNLGQDDLLEKIQMRNSSVIRESFVIPKSLVEGYRANPGPYFGDVYQVNLKALRLFAAQEKCDILILVSSAFYERSDINILGCLNIFIIPAFFLPYNDISAQYVCEAFIFDVKTGYMYRHMKYSAEPYSRDFVTAADERKIVTDINQKFLNESSAELRRQILNALKG